MTSDLDLDAARDFVASAGWQFAISMPDEPHEYIVRGRATGGVDAAPIELHDWFARLIGEHGYQERYEGRWYRYLDLDGWKYGGVVQEVINRERGERHPTIPRERRGQLKDAGPGKRTGMGRPLTS